MKELYFALMTTSRWRLQSDLAGHEYFKQISAYSEPVTKEQYVIETGTSPYNTGSTEVFGKVYKDNGYLVMKIESMNPERTKKTVKEFKFDFERSI